MKANKILITLTTAVLLLAAQRAFAPPDPPPNNQHPPANQPPPPPPNGQPQPHPQERTTKKQLQNEPTRIPFKVPLDKLGLPLGSGYDVEHWVGDQVPGVTNGIVPEPQEPQDMSPEQILESFK